MINKIDKPNARPDDMINEVFDLLCELEAPDDALDFSVVYVSAKEGWATTDTGGRHPRTLLGICDTGNVGSLLMPNAHMILPSMTSPFQSSRHNRRFVRRFRWNLWEILC